MVDVRLPSLRTDLKLYPGHHDEDGAPRWLLYDAVSNRYFTLFERTLTLLRHWQPGLTVDEMVNRLRDKSHDRKVPLATLRSRKGRSERVQEAGFCTIICLSKSH